MGVDFYACENCGDTFPDCGTYIHCEHGHRIGPCCFPLAEGKKFQRVDRWPGDQTVESDDYSTAVAEAFCPVCAKGGNDQQKIAKLAKLLRLAKTYFSIHKNTPEDWIALEADIDEALRGT